MTTNSMMTSDGQIRLTGSMTQKNERIRRHVLHTLTDTNFIMYALQLLPPLWASFTPIVDVCFDPSASSYLPFNSGNFNYYFQLSKMVCASVLFKCFRSRIVSAAVAVSVLYLYPDLSL